MRLLNSCFSSAVPQNTCLSSLQSLPIIFIPNRYFPEQRTAISFGNFSRLLFHATFVDEDLGGNWRGGGLRGLQGHPTVHTKTSWLSLARFGITRHQKMESSTFSEILGSWNRSRFLPSFLVPASMEHLLNSDPNIFHSYVNKSWNWSSEVGNLGIWKDAHWTVLEIVYPKVVQLPLCFSWWQIRSWLFPDNIYKVKRNQQQLLP